MAGSSFRQASAAPMFQGSETNTENLLCSAGCGQILVERYRADCFAEVSMECFTCGHVTTTPSFPIGEVMPHVPLIMSDEGAYAIEGTVYYQDAVTIGANSVLRSAIAATTPRENDFQLDVSGKGIAALLECFESATGADIALQRRIIARGGKKVRVDFPFIWAAQHLLQQHDPMALETIEATEALSMFGSSHTAWSHHPRYSVVARQMAAPGKFFHTAFTFMAAHYLFQSGNKIGLSLEDTDDEANPDLYFWIGKPKRSYIEVKAPNTLQATGAVDSPLPRMQSLIKETTKRASRQINRHKPGILVIGMSHIQHYLLPHIDRVRRNTIQTVGRNNRGLAGMVTITPIAPWTAKARRAGYVFDSTHNPHFDGDNPLAP